MPYLQQISTLPFVRLLQLPDTKMCIHLRR